jgi:hypothetical protein
LGDLPGFSFSPDGKRIAFGGPEDGLYVVDAATFDLGSGSFRDIAVWASPGTPTVFSPAGTSFRAGEARVPRSRCRATTPRRSARPLMNLCDVTPRVCADESTYSAACPARYTEPAGFRADFQTAACSVSTDDDPADPGSRGERRPVGGVDANPSGPMDTPSGDSTLEVTNEGCSAAAASAGDGTSATWWLLALAPLMRRRVSNRNRARRD